MKSYFNIFIVLLISFLLFQRCSEDTPTEPTDKPSETLASSNIGSSGGTIITDNIEITIPAGAFQDNSELKILKSTEDNLFDNNSLSDFFVLDGLPTEISKPIDIKIKYNGTLTDSSFIAVGSEGFAKSLSENTTSFQLLSAKDSSGYLVTTLPPLSGNALGKSSSVNGDKFAINLGAIFGYVSYISQQGHFKINFPSSVLTQTYDLADYLEDAYSKIKAMGFSYSRRTKWPVEVTVKRLKSTVFGYSANSAWGDNYGWLEFNFDKMDNKEELKVTAGHEFFHLVQNLYDSRNRYSKSRNPMPNYWLDEASAVWAEEYFSSNSNYVSPIFTDNASDILKGAKTGSITDEAAAYGYGMASFIKYLTKKHGNKALVKVYENIYNGKDVFSALSQVLTVDVGYNWNSYLKSLFTFEFYKNDQFKSASMLAIAKQKKQKFTIKSESDTVKTYKSSLTDLSATMFSIKNEFENLNSNANLQFTCKGWNFQIYKINSSESKFLESGKDSLTLSEFKDITDKGYQIVAVLYNDDFDKPYNHSEDYEMKIEVKADFNEKIIITQFNQNYITKKKKPGPGLSGQEITSKLNVNGEVLMSNLNTVKLDASFLNSELDAIVSINIDVYSDELIELNFKLLPVFTPTSWTWLYTGSAYTKFTYSYDTKPSYEVYDQSASSPTLIIDNETGIVRLSFNPKIHFQNDNYRKWEISPWFKYKQDTYAMEKNPDGSETGKEIIVLSSNGKELFATLSLRIRKKY